MVHVLATVKIRPGTLPQFMSLLKTMLPAIEKHGVKLLGSYAHEIGRVNAVVDLWQAPSYDALKASFMDPEVTKWDSQVNEIVEDEVLALLAPIPL